MRVLYKLTLLYISLLSLYTFSMICVYFIPKHSIFENVKKSVDLIDNEGIVPLVYGTPFYRLDTFTDCLMLNAALCSDDNEHIQSAFVNNIYLKDNDNILSSTKELILNNNGNLSLNSYARYWHGYALFLRPLLTITDYNGIRNINIISLYALSIIITILLYMKKQRRMAITFFLSILMINLYIVAQTMQFSTCFYISFIGMLFIILFPKIVYKDKYIYLFFGIGSLTAFLDLLTTPLITLGLPLLTYIGIYVNNGRVRKTFISSLAWGAGYCSIWISKWILSYFITGQNTLESAEKAAMTRISRLNIVNNIKWSVGIDIKEFIHSNTFYLSIIIIISILLLSYIFMKSKHILNSFSSMKEYTYLIIIAFYVPIWFYIMKNHSFVHLWFTWRNVIVPLWCLLLYLSYFINLKNRYR